jgi:hypothetical protein
MVSDTNLSQRDRLLLVLLFLLEASMVIILKTLHMKGERTIEVFALSTMGLVFLGASLVLLVTGVVLIHLYRSHRRSPSHYFRLILALNLVTVFLMMVAGETIVRAGSRIYRDGEVFGNVALVPKNWELTKAHYRALLEKARGDLSYLIYDARMGWSVGPNRRSANGLYRSDPNRIRVPEEGVAFSMDERNTTIALVGDSYTFGEEVKYEDSWGYHLNQLLGGEVQVLNFGVPGYGVDQAYLRYEKDAKRWKPKVVIFGLFSHDLRRTLTVYPFLAHQHWDMPFSKPRFVLSNGTLEMMNEPPPGPEAIFSHPSIVELPSLGLDYAYKESLWQHRIYHASYLYRLFVSLFSSQLAEVPDYADEALLSINTAIIKAFVRAAAQDGTIPVTVYFPEKGELETSRLHGERVLHDARIGYVDPTPCLLEVNPADRYMSGGHYAPAAGAAVAKCLLPVIQDALRQAGVGQETAMTESLPQSN